jgi:hypothetical protein
VSGGGLPPPWTGGQSYLADRPYLIVMLGLGPSTHAFPRRHKGVDGRDKHGHDEKRLLLPAVTYPSQREEPAYT